MILIALGANLPGPWGEPEEGLRAALTDFPAFGLEVRGVSPFYRTVAITPYPQPDFVNAVAEIATSFSPEELLATLHAVEDRFGRVRTQRWSERTLDLDLIDYDGKIQRSRDGCGLELPHPRTHERGFVLAPMADLAPNWVHPILGQSASQLLQSLAQEERDGLHRLGLRP